MLISALALLCSFSFFQKVLVDRGSEVSFLFKNIFILFIFIYFFFCGLQTCPSLFFENVNREYMSVLIS